MRGDSNRAGTPGKYAERPGGRRVPIGLSKARVPSRILAVRLMVGTPGPRSRDRPMPRLELNDSEMSMLLTLSAPIDQRLRSQFLQEVAQEPEAKGHAGEIGEGSVHRVARTVQRRFSIRLSLAKQVSARSLLA